MNHRRTRGPLVLVAVFGLAAALHPATQAAMAAAGTVAVAIFGAVQVWREVHRDREERSAARARVGFLAFGLRRQLISWVGGEPHPGSGFEDWITSAKSLGMLGAHLDAAERRVDEMSRLAPKLETSDREAVQEASVLFLAGAGRLNEFVATPRPSSGLALSWKQLRIDAMKDFLELSRLLEIKLTPKEMLGHEKRVDEDRENHNILRTFYSHTAPPADTLPMPNSPESS